MNFRASSPIHLLFPLRNNLACIRPVASLALLDATDNTDSGQISTDSEAIICLALDLKQHTRWREALGPADWLQLDLRGHRWSLSRGPRGKRRVLRNVAADL